MHEVSLTKLSIVNAQFFAFHGVKPEERKLGGRYEVDLELFYDATTAIINDDVKDAVNYEEALFCISEIIKGEEEYNLVETICSEILHLIMDKFVAVEMATVRLRKYAVPMQGIVAYIEAEQSIERDEE
mgnify:CR=1 FL=1